MNTSSDFKNAPDEELVGRLKWKDYPAFVGLFDRYRDRIVSYAARMTGDADQAESLAHDIFLRMVNESGAYPAGTSVFIWLFKIAREVVQDYVLKNKPEARASLDKLAAIGASENPSTDARNTFLALNRIGPVYREVLYLRVFEKMSHKDIAAVTGEKIKTVKTRMNYAVEHLRKELR